MTTNWKPNRKVIASLVAGIVTLAGGYLAARTGVEFDEGTAASLVGLIMTAVGYLVPLSDEDIERANASR
jgi:hypothetical protein